ncbi:MAG: oxygenase MpaB family protein [Paracoccaceae bacterium]|nr:oxygenase MpaB family protein [Paracoccaceae bacterium]MDE2913620.1 oxygenase MpaB family protein [Paracoccaceae bacterium]
MAEMAVRAFHRNSDTILAGLALGAIPIGFSTMISKPFRIRSRLVMNGVRRLKQNLRQLMEQFLPGGNEPGGDAWRLSLRIRIVHAQSRHFLLESDEWDAAVYGTPLSASHMNLGAAGFSGGLMLYVMMLGGDFTDEERDAYAHVWRYTGVTMGIPETIMFTDQESALEVSRIGAECEPPPDEDSIIMANSIVNSVPLVLGVKDPKIRQAKAQYFYKISRELMGDEMADRLRFPPKHRIKVVPIAHVRTKLKQRLGRLPVLSRMLRRERFGQMLYVTDLGNLDHSYNLPTALLDDESRDW